jgi:VWFA-related protein
MVSPSTPPLTLSLSKGERALWMYLSSCVRPRSSVDRLRTSSGGRRCTAAAAVAALSLSVLFAAEPPPAIHAVRLDAIVVDARGRLVEDLKPSDFEVREDGAPHSLDSAQFTRARGGRLFAIFLDEYHLSADAVTARVRDALTRFVDSTLAEDDQLVVMKPLDSLFAIQLGRDRGPARQAIASFEGRKGDYTPKNAYERNYIAGTPARVEAARTQVSLSALNALAIHLGSAGDGRKTLMVVTEGIPRPERRRGQESLPTFDTIVRSAARSMVAVYPIDPREATSEERPDDALRAMALETNGALIGANLDAGLARVAADAGAYYLLTYSAPHAEDGRFHEVQVRITRPGMTLRTRHGYWAPSPDDALRTQLLARMNAPPPPPKPLEPARHISPLIRPWFGLSRGEAGNTRVTIVWEPTARVPGDRTRRSNPARIVLTAKAPDGTVLFEGTVKPTGPGAVEQRGVTPARAVFDAPPGRVRLQMSIQDVAEQVLDSDVRDLAVPDFRKPVGIGTPEVLRARNAREFRLLDEQPSVPVASREFSRTERLLIRFAAYAPTGDTPSVTAKLMSRLGQSMRDLTINSSRDGEHEIDLPLAGLANGEYIIELTATSPAGEASDRFGFRVTS